MKITFDDDREDIVIASKTEKKTKTPKKLGKKEKLKINDKESRKQVGSIHQEWKKETGNTQ